MTLSEEYEEEYENEYPDSKYGIEMILKEIQMEIDALVNIASEMLKKSEFSSATSRAEVYWIPHITTALSKDHSYLGGSMCTMEDTINEIREYDEDE